MVCDAADLERVKHSGCFPTHDNVLDSVVIVDAWHARHTFIPFLITLMSGNPYMAIAGAYVYETMGLLNQVYGDVPLFGMKSLYTGCTDAMVQDGGFAVLGSLCAYVLHVAFWRRTGVTWTTLVRRFSDDLIIEERWGETPWRWPWILLKHLAFNVLVILLYRYMNLTKTFIKSIGGEHARRWGSTNHLAVPLFLGLAWCVFLARPQKGGPPRPPPRRDKWTWYVLVVLVGPCVVLNLTGGFVSLACKNEAAHDAVCSTFLWSWVCLGVYAAASAAVVMWCDVWPDDQHPAADDAADAAVVTVRKQRIHTHFFRPAVRFY